jgi:hypothetical protein
MKTTIVFYYSTLAYFLHKKPNLLSRYYKTVPKSSFVNVAIFDAASNTFFKYTHEGKK